MEELDASLLADGAARSGPFGERKSWVFGVVRHCERADGMMTLVDGKSWTSSADFRAYPFDPPLSDAGVAGAQKVGGRVRAFVEGMGRTDKYLVVSSPFRRCVQTAAAIAAQLGAISASVDLVLDHAFAEVHGPQILPTQTEPETLLRPLASSVDYCRQLGVQCPPIVAGSRAAWPEDMVSAQERYARAFMSTLAQAKEKGTTVIVVTHHLCVFTALSMMPSHRGSRIEDVQHGGMFLARPAMEPAAPPRRRSVPRRAPKVAQDIQALNTLGLVRNATAEPSPDGDCCTISFEPAGRTRRSSLPGTRLRAELPLGVERQADLVLRSDAFPWMRSESLPLPSDRPASHWHVTSEDIKVKRVAHAEAPGCVRFLRDFLWQSSILLAEYEQLLGRASDPDAFSRQSKRLQETRCRSASYMGLPSSLACRAFEEPTEIEATGSEVLRLCCSADTQKAFEEPTLEQRQAIVVSAAALEPGGVPNLEAPGEGPAPQSHRRSSKECVLVPKLETSALFQRRRRAFAKGWLGAAEEGCHLGHDPLAGFPSEAHAG